MDKIIKLNKPKRQYDHIQKYWRCERCDQEWHKDHTEVCEWYKELKETRKR